MSSYSNSREEAKPDTPPPGWPKMFYHASAPEGRVFYRPEDVPADWVTGPHLIGATTAPDDAEDDTVEYKPRRRGRKASV